MLALVALLVALNDGATPTPHLIFKAVVRGRIVRQSIAPANLPACSVFRIVDRENPATRSAEKSKIKWVFGVDIVGSQNAQPNIDTELIELKSYVKKALLNSTLGGLVGSIEYRGSDTANFAPIPQGAEIVAFETLLVLTKTDPWQQKGSG